MSRQGVIEGPVRFRVVTEGIVVVYCVDQKPIHLAVVVLNATSRVRVVRIRMTTAGEIPCEMMCGMCNAGGVLKG